MYATLIHTRQFDGMIHGLLSEDELAILEYWIAANPEGHPVVPGAGGVRKARWARRGMGKRGGIRVIYYYSVRHQVALFIAAYAKNVQENLTNADKKAISKVVRDFEENLRS